MKKIFTFLLMATIMPIFAMDGSAQKPAEPETKSKTPKTGKKVSFAPKPSNDSLLTAFFTESEDKNNPITHWSQYSDDPEEYAVYLLSIATICSEMPKIQKRHSPLTTRPRSDSDSDAPLSIFGSDYSDDDQPENQSLCDKITNLFNSFK